MTRARSGGGPTLIEAVTYRIGPHTTADDPGRYRPDEEAAEWRRKDPLERVRLFLSEREQWTPEWQTQIEAEAATEIDRAIELAERLPVIGAHEIFDAMFEEPPDHLLRQQDEAMAGRLSGDQP